MADCTGFRARRGAAAFRRPEPLLPSHPKSMCAQAHSVPDTFACMGLGQQSTHVHRRGSCEVVCPIEISFRRKESLLADGGKLLDQADDRARNEGGPHSVPASQYRIPTLSPPLLRGIPIPWIVGER